MSQKDLQGKDKRLASFFSASPRERAAFEAGIKLGGIYHQYTGMPISGENKAAVEKAIEKSVKVQPYVHAAKVEIRKPGLHNKRGQFDYGTLGGEDLYVELELIYQGVTVLAVMEYLEEEGYPLMYIKEVREE
jgi:dihydroneopterin aldolase